MNIEFIPFFFVFFLLLLLFSNFYIRVNDVDEFRFTTRQQMWVACVRMVTSFTNEAKLAETTCSWSGLEHLTLRLFSALRVCSLFSRVTSFRIYLLSVCMLLADLVNEYIFLSGKFSIHSQISIPRNRYGLCLVPITRTPSTSN